MGCNEEHIGSEPFIDFIGSMHVTLQYTVICVKQVSVKNITNDVGRRLSSTHTPYLCIVGLICAMRWLYWPTG